MTKLTATNTTAPNIFVNDISEIILISFPTIVNSNTDYEKQYAFPNNFWYS